MSQSLIQGKRFYCREWVFSKLWHCLQHRPDEDGDGKNGILIVGGPGAGKTALCSEIVSPSVSQGKQKTLRKRLLAHHFCQAHDSDTLNLTNFICHLAEQLSKSQLIPGYLEKIGEETFKNIIDNAYNYDIDVLFHKLVLYPLLEIDKPKSTSFILIDSIDESSAPTPTQSQPAGAGVCSGSVGSKTISELLGNHAHLLPSWLILICTARKQSKPVAKIFTGFRKIGLDDLRKSQVVRDVQQYILSRLDQDYNLRQHISRETAEMLNQLHIKSNGCFLYLEKVLDGISENFIVLREIREIPGTLYGLYLWLCQRLFTKKQFSRVQLILSILLASPKPLNDEDIFNLLKMKNLSITKEEFSKRMHILRRVLIKSDEGYILFHHSFAEWLIDVKYCTRKYLCQTGEGHGCFVTAITTKTSATDISQSEIITLAYHIANTPKTILDSSLQSVFLLSTVYLANTKLNQKIPDQKVIKLLESCGISQETRQISLEESDKSEPNSSFCQQAIDKEKNDHDQINNTDIEVSANANVGSSDEALLDEKVSLEKPEAVSTTINNNEQEELETNLIDLLEDINQFDCNQRTPLHNAANEGNCELIELLINKGAKLEVVDKHGRTPLNLASRQGHESIVEALLEAGAQFDHADKDGWTPLRSAAWAGHASVVDSLLAKGAEVDLTDGDGRTALRAASWGGHEEVVVSLLRAGASPSLTDNEGRTPLIAAAYMGHSEIIERLLNAGADVNHCDSDGRSALSVATLLCVSASQGHLKVVTLLLERNAAVNNQDKDGSTALLVASFEGHKEVCELLLEFEADVDIADKVGRTPLWAAASMGHEAVCELLLFWGAYIDHIDGEGRTVLTVASAQGNVNVVKLLLARGLDEGHRDNSGWTPLHYASFEGHQEVCETLLEAGARVDVADNDGKHSLLLSAQEGHLNVVECLINYGAFVDQRSHDGRSALRAASVEGYRDIVQYLVSRGSDVNYRDTDGRSTLYLLSLENRVAMAQFLITRCGADIEARDLEGRTPLHVSSWQGHLEMVELLISSGAEVNATDNDKRSPLQSASWQGHCNIVKLLCERGAKIDHTCNQGATALCIAAQEGHIESVRILLDWRANPFHTDRCGRTPMRVALKSGHGEITKLIDEAVARNKMMQLTWEDSNQNNYMASKPSNPNYNTGIPYGGYDMLPLSPLSSPVSAHDVEKRRYPQNFNSAGRNSYNSRSAEMPYNNEIKNHINPHDKIRIGAAANKGYEREGKYSNCGPLSFTQQVEQVSRGKGHRPKSKMMSPVGSPIYASPPQSPLHEESFDDDTKSPSSHNLFNNFSGGQSSSASSACFLSKKIFNNNGESHQKISGAHISTRSNVNNFDANSFAFNRDSHMKIILGSSDNRNRKNGAVHNVGNGGISSATSAILSGLNAIKLGVLEAGRKLNHSDSPLISAATQEPRSMLLDRDKNKP